MHLALPLFNGIAGGLWVSSWAEWPEAYRHETFTSEDLTITYGSIPVLSLNVCTVHETREETIVERSL
jgi:hypothetical protein